MKISRPPTDWKPNGEWSLSWDVLLGIARQLLDPEVAPVPVEDHLASLLYAIDPEPQLSDLASDYFLLGDKDQHGPEPIMVSPQTIRREALSVLAKIEEVLDAYSWDHNSARPTDPTVVLPLVRRALALASFEEDEARKAARPGRGER